MRATESASASTSAPVRLPPGPSGSLIPTYRLINDPLAALREWHERYGDTFTVNKLGLRTVVTADPELVGQIYAVRDPELFDAVLQPAADALFGPNSLLMISGNRHARERKLMAPPFHGERLKGWAATMAEAARKAFAGGGELRIADGIKRATIEVIVRVVFGVEEDARVKQFIAEIEEWTSLIRPGFLFLRALQHDYFGLAPYARYRVKSEQINAMLLDQVARVRAGQGPRTDVLTGLIEGRYDDGTAMDDAAVRDHLRTLLFGGHETTATTVTWVLYFVHRYPQLRARVLEEIAALGPTPDPEAFPRLTYLGAVIDETLRMRPVTTEISRTLRKDWDLGPWRLPAGTAVCPAVSVLHFKPDLWPEPERFKPERFLEGRPAPNSFIPFGGGSHRCLGATFARFEISVLIATLLREFEFELLDDNVQWGRGRAALEAVGGVPARVRPL